MLWRYLSFAPLVMTILQGCQSDNSDQLVALQQRVATLDSQLKETGSQLKETDSQLKETRLQITGLQTANQELDRAFRDLAAEIAPFTGPDILPPPLMVELDEKKEIRSASVAKPQEEQKTLAASVGGHADADDPPVLAMASPASSGEEKPVLAVVPTIAPSAAAQPVLAAPPVLAPLGEEKPVLAAVPAVLVLSSKESQALPAPVAKPAEVVKPTNPAAQVVATPDVRTDENSKKRVASAAKPRKKAKAIVRLARRSTGGISCGQVWKLLDQGKSHAAAAEALTTSIAVVKDCKQEMLRVRQDKGSDGPQIKS